jgi:hypothetical protein
LDFHSERHLPKYSAEGCYTFGDIEKKRAAAFPLLGGGAAVNRQTLSSMR